MKHLIIILILLRSLALLIITKPKATINSKNEFFELKAKRNHIARLSKVDSG